MSDRRYWAIRTDKGNMDLILKELFQGRLRQGWGCYENQDLLKIKKDIETKGKDLLSDDQRAASRNMRMLSSAEDSIKIGDIILTLNLPKQNYFCLVEVVGDYYFDRLELNQSEDINLLGRDYGHVLPVKVITPNGVSKSDDLVEDEFYSSLRTPMRMWNLDRYSSSIENLLEKFI